MLVARDGCAPLARTRRALVLIDGPLPPDNFRHKKIGKRLDFVCTENRREGYAFRRRPRRKSVTRPLRIGAVEPAGHLGAGKPATNGFDKGRTIEPRLAQA